MPHPRFKISKGTGDEYNFNLTAANGEKNGQQYFVLKAANHEIVGVSETYTSSAALRAGIEDRARQLLQLDCDSLPSRDLLLFGTC